MRDFTRFDKIEDVKLDKVPRTEGQSVPDATPMTHRFSTYSRRWDDVTLNVREDDSSFGNAGPQGLAPARPGVPER